MCYTLEASITNGIISAITCWVLYTKTHNRVVKFLSIFFLFVSLMQWYDAIFWADSGQINRVFTKIAMITNHLQPLVLASVVILSGITLSNTSNFILSIYTIYAVIYSAIAFNQIDLTQVTEISAPVLDWQWNNLAGGGVMYTLFLLAFSSISLDIGGTLSLLLLIINLGTFAFSAFAFKRENLGQAWCQIAAYVPLLFLGW